MTLIFGLNLKTIINKIAELAFSKHLKVNLDEKPEKVDFLRFINNPVPFDETEKSLLFTILMIHYLTSITPFG